MAKYISSAILIVIIAFILNWFNVVHISFLDLPDVEEQNKIALNKSASTLKLLE